MLSLCSYCYMMQIVIELQIDFILKKITGVAMCLVAIPDFKKIFFIHWILHFEVINDIIQGIQW